MNEVIRLLRISLILRIAAALVGAIMIATILPSPLPALLDLALLTPTFIILAITLIAPGRGWLSEGFVKKLLVAVIVAQAIEAVFTRLQLQLLVAIPDGLTAGSLRQFSSLLPEWAMMRLPLNVPQLFITIPALLGAWMSGRRGAMRWALFTVVMSLLGSLSLSPPEFTEFRLNLGVLGAQGVVVFVTCYFVASLADQQRAEQAQLQTANRRLAEQALVREQLAASRERVRLARDLHDTLAHTLAGLVVQSQVVDTLMADDPAAARRELARVQEVAKRGLEETRAAINDLRANIVEDLGLSSALNRQLEIIAQRNNYEAHFQQEGSEPQLDSNVAQTLFRIAQEALNNVERHARATHVNLTLTNASESGVSIRVQDDGVGFDVSMLDNEWFGLRGMRERAEMIGAHLRVDSSAGKGTIVTVTLRKEIGDCA